MTPIQELEIKINRVRAFMEKKKLAAVYFKAQCNFSWLTCGGGDQIIHGYQEGFPGILVGSDDLFVVADNIEMPRLQSEELGELPFKPVEYSWMQGEEAGFIREIIGKGEVGTDLPLSFGTFDPEIDELRVPLTAAEIKRFEDVAILCSECFDNLPEQLTPGMSELQIQSLVAGQLLGRGVFPLVLLVGTDQRIFKFRHPKPTKKKLERYCMIVICAECGGLILSMTRLFHFGKLPSEIAAKYEALLKVDLTYITETRKGNTLSRIFEAGRRMYREVGFPGEEGKHYQGGTCGYLIREQDLEQNNDYRIQQGEIFAHNPSITGVAVEDSILLEEEGYRVLTLSESWPSREIEYGGTIIRRPEILCL
jgi:antitoxin VapB